MSKTKKESTEQAPVESTEQAPAKTYRNPSEETEIIIIKTDEGMVEGEMFTVGIQVADTLVSRGLAKIV